MENAIKLQQQCKDPFACLIEPLLRELVFQHLSGRDVLNVFAVSKNFNKEAMKSSKAMSKIKLNVASQDYVITCPSEEERDRLINTRRPYKNAQITLGGELDFGDAILLLRKLSPKLEEAKLFYKLPLPRRFPVGMSFPLLKRLTLDFWDWKEARKVIAATSNHLQELSIINLDEDSILIFSAIEENLSGGNSEITRKTFYELRSSFKDFLLPVIPTLQKLNVELCGSANFELVLTKLPALKVLVVKILDFGKAQEYLENKSIATLDIDYWDACLPGNTLRCMKNLETILVHGREVFKEVLGQAKHAKKLKKIVVRGSSDRSPHAIYQEMMAADPTIPRGIEIIEE